MRNRMTGSRNVLAMLVIVGVAALAGGIACSASAAERFEGEWPRGVTTSIPGVTGNLELLLLTRGGNETVFRADGRAEGEGLVDNAAYSMWVSDQEGNALFLDAARADQECEVGFAGGEGDCQLTLKLRSNQPQAPFDATTLEGLTVHIREGLGTDGPIAPAAIKLAMLRGEVVMGFTVRETDL